MAFSYTARYSRAAFSQEKFSAIADARRRWMCCGRSNHVETAQPIVSYNAAPDGCWNLKPVPLPSHSL